MRFLPGSYVASPVELAASIARLLPEYLPGRETGPAAITDKRSCWTKSMRALLETLGRHHQTQVHADDLSEWGVGKQLKILWKQGDAVALAALSGWGDREELERSFQRLELVKAPQKLILYTCARWQEAVLEQLSAALLRYPHHIEGEQYLALNLLGSESRLVAHLCQIPRSGSLTLPEVTFAALPGSPYRWGSTHSVSA